MNGKASDLWEAYKATAFKAETPFGLLSIRVGNVEPGLEALLAENLAGDWAFITAHNPGSQPLDEAENTLRHARLVAEISQRSYPCFPGRGVGDDSTWQPEESLLVIGMSRDEAIEVGRMFGQNAVVWGCLGQPAELVDCRPDRSP